MKELSQNNFEAVFLDIYPRAVSKQLFN